MGQCITIIFSCFVHLLCRIYSGIHDVDSDKEMYWTDCGMRRCIYYAVTQIVKTCLYLSEVIQIDLPLQCYINCAQLQNNLFYLEFICIKIWHTSIKKIRIKI